MIMAFTYIFLDIFSIFMAYKVLVNAPFRRQRKVYLITIGIVGMAIVVLHTILGKILVDGFVLVAGLMIPFVWIEHKGKIKKLGQFFYENMLLVQKKDRSYKSDGKMERFMRG